MALDRFIEFGKKKPSRDDVESVLRNFFGEAGEVEWNQDRFTVKLQGPGTFPFEGLVPDHMPNLRNKERWIEVCPGNPMDVITRRQDDYTNSLAAGLAETFARFWEGEVEPSD